MATIPVAQPYSNDALSEVERAQMLARRYHAEFVDLKNFKIQHDLFKSVPVDIMFRYNFVPLEQTAGRLAIAEFWADRGLFASAPDAVAFLAAEVGDD